MYCTVLYIYIHKQVSKKTEQTAPPAKSCNCQKANLPCVMGGKCVEGNVVYQGAVMRNNTGQTDFPRANFSRQLLRLFHCLSQTNPEDFPLFFRLLD